jgi:hypothetical protein
MIVFDIFPSFDISNIRSGDDWTSSKSLCTLSSFNF